MFTKEHFWKTIIGSYRYGLVLYSAYLHVYTCILFMNILLKLKYYVGCFQCNTIREFDTAYTIKIFNYTNVYHYYEDATLSNKLHLINVPCLCLSAADDPFLYFRGMICICIEYSAKMGSVQCTPYLYGKYNI